MAPTTRETIKAYIPAVAVGAFLSHGLDFLLQRFVAQSPMIYTFESHFWSFAVYFLLISFLAWALRKFKHIWVLIAASALLLILIQVNKFSMWLGEGQTLTVLNSLSRLVFCPCSVGMLPVAFYRSLKS